MNIPNFFVSESEKTEKWIESIAQWIVFNRHSSGKKEDALLWGAYHNTMQENRFDYFLKFGNNDLPAKARHIPLQRHLIDLLASEMTQRPRNMSVSTIDQESIDDKQKKISMGMIKDMLDNVRATRTAVETQMAIINQRSEQLGQVLQQEAETPEQQQELERIRAVMPAIMAQIELVQKNLKTEKDILDRKARDIERYYKMDWKDIKETVAEALLNSFYKTLKIKDKEKKSFISNCVLGKHAYYVDQIENEKLPRFEVVDYMKLFFPVIDGTDWIQDGPWAMLEDNMTFPQVAIEFGDKIVKKYDKAKLTELSERFASDSTDGTFVSTPDGDMPYNKAPYSGTRSNQPPIKVYRIFFKSQRKERVRFSPNPHQKGKFFKHFLNPYAKIINEDEYKYIASREEYVSKTNKEDVIRKRDAESYNVSKGQFVEDFYTNDVYEAVVIDRDITINTRKKRFSPRGIEKHADVKLPIFGRSFSSYSEKPYSLIYATKDIQELYDVVWTNIELMMALAGTKSVLYDRSQKPDDLSDHDWQYQKKLGNIPIQTMDADGNPRRSSFNQWTEVDLSLSSSVQYLEQILERLETSMGNVIGIPRQRLAQTKDTDQVGTFKESIKRSYLITEILFNNHEEVLEEALTQLVNIGGRYTYRNGGKIEVSNKGFGREMVTITKDLLRFLDLKAIVDNSGEDQFKMQELRELAGVHYKGGQLPFGDLVDIFDSSTLGEMKSKVEYFGEKAQELAQQVAEAQGNKDEQTKMKMLQFQQEFDGYWKQKELEIASFKEQFEQKDAEFKNNLEQERLDLEKLEVGVNARLKLFELVNEKDSEDNAVISNMTAEQASNKLSAIEIQLNYMLRSAEIAINKDKNDKDHTEKMKKITTDGGGKKMVKEHVRDN